MVYVNEKQKKPAVEAEKRCMWSMTPSSVCLVHLKCKFFWLIQSLTFVLDEWREAGSLLISASAICCQHSMSFTVVFFFSLRQKFQKKKCLYEQKQTIIFFYYEVHIYVFWIVSLCLIAGLLNYYELIRWLTSQICADVRITIVPGF